MKIWSLLLMFAVTYCVGLSDSLASCDPYVIGENIDSAKEFVESNGENKSLPLQGTESLKIVRQRCNSSGSKKFYVLEEVIDGKSIFENSLYVYVDAATNNVLERKGKVYPDHGLVYSALVTERIAVDKARDWLIGELQLKENALEYVKPTELGYLPDKSCNKLRLVWRVAFKIYDEKSHTVKSYIYVDALDGKVVRHSGVGAGTFAPLTE